MQDFLHQQNECSQSEAMANVSCPSSRAGEGICPRVTTARSAKKACGGFPNLGVPLKGL